MAANLSYHQPIGSVETYNNNTPLTASIVEQSGQTFKLGVPVQLNAGFIRQWDGTTIAAAIAGFSLIPGSNLATSGAGAPGPFAQIGPPGTIQTYGNVPNQASAVNIAVGAPITDGRTLFEASIGNTVFEATFDNSTGTNAASYTPLFSQIGTTFGLTVDASGQFYVDNGKTTAGTNTVVTLVGINPIDLATGTTAIVNARVRFTVLPAAKQIF